MGLMCKLGFINMGFSIQLLRGIDFKRGGEGEREGSHFSLLAREKTGLSFLPFPPASPIPAGPPEKPATAALSQAPGFGLYLFQPKAAWLAQLRSLEELTPPGSMTANLQAMFHCWNMEDCRPLFKSVCLFVLLLPQYLFGFFPTCRLLYYLYSRFSCHMSAPGVTIVLPHPREMPRSFAPAPRPSPNSGCLAEPGRTGPSRDTAPQPEPHRRQLHSAVAALGGAGGRWQRCPRHPPRSLRALPGPAAGGSVLALIR